MIKTIIEALLTREYSSKIFAAINNEFNRLFYYNNLDNFFHDVPEVAEKIKETRTSEGLTSIDQLSILEQNISDQNSNINLHVEDGKNNSLSRLYGNVLQLEYVSSVNLNLKCFRL